MVAQIGVFLTASASTTPPPIACGLAAAKKPGRFCKWSHAPDAPIEKPINKDGLATGRPGPPARSTGRREQEGRLTLYVAIISVPYAKAAFLHDSFVRGTDVATAVQIDHERVLVAWFQILRRIDHMLQRAFAQQKLAGWLLGLQQKQKVQCERHG